MTKVWETLAFRIVSKFFIYACIYGHIWYVTVPFQGYLCDIVGSVLGHRNKANTTTKEIK